MIDAVGVDVVASLVALGAAALLAALVTPLAGAFAVRVGAIDLPGGRRLHARPTPRLGGVAVYFAAGLGVAVAFAALDVGADDERLKMLWPILGATGCVCVLGAIDDARPLRARTKLLGLVAAGAVAVACGVRIDFVELPALGRVDLGWWALPLTLAWLVGCANAMNLIDGVDGAGAGIAAVSAIALGLVALAMGDAVGAVVYFGLAGATGGFLCHNRHPARIFLGDSGALAIGFLIAANAAAGCTKRATALSFAAALLALAVPLFDCTHSFVRRFRRALASGEGRARLRRALRATAVADRGHLHHRLLGSGLSPRAVARVLCLVSLTTGGSALLLLQTQGEGLVVFAAAVAAAAVVLGRVAAVAAPEAEASEAEERAGREPTVLIPRASREAAARGERPVAQRGRARQARRRELVRED